MKVLQIKLVSRLAEHSTVCKQQTKKQLGGLFEDGSKVHYKDRKFAAYLANKSVRTDGGKDVTRRNLSKVMCPDLLRLALQEEDMHFI